MASPSSSLRVRIAHVGPCLTVEALDVAAASMLAALPSWPRGVGALERCTFGRSEVWALLEDLERIGILLEPEDGGGVMLTDLWAVGLITAFFVGLVAGVWYAGLRS